MQFMFNIYIYIYVCVCVCVYTYIGVCVYTKSVQGIVEPNYKTDGWSRILQNLQLI